MNNNNISRRDYFAAKALQGLLAHPDTCGSLANYVEKSIRYADTMIALLDQKSDEKVKESLKLEEKKSSSNLFKLPSGLKKYEAIAEPMIKLVASVFEIKRCSARDAIDIACWQVIDKNTKTKAKAYLYLTQGFEWTFEALKIGGTLPEEFEFDIYDWASDNDVHLEELYASLSCQDG